MAKIFVVSGQLILSVVLIYLLAKVFDFKKAALMVGLFSLEPFFVGNSRLLHLDVLLTLFLLNVHVMDAKLVSLLALIKQSGKGRR